MTNRDRSPLDGWTARRWPWHLAVAFVLLTLVTLATLPWAVQRRVVALRAEIVASEPARTLVMQWQFNLVREMAALSELLLTGDSAQAATYGTAWATEQEVHDRLAPLATAMGPVVLQSFVEARTLAEQWHARVNYDDILGHRAAGTVPLEVPRERRLFEEVLASVAAVDSSIIRMTAATRAEIAAAEQAGVMLTVVLAMLALFAAGAVIALDARVRRLAAEAERRRWEADAALADATRASEARTRLLRGITHDVKNPLGAAKGYAELLAMGVKAPLAPGQAPLVEGLERSIDSALAIIADLLDLARADSVDVSVKRVATDLRSVVRAAVEDYRAVARTSGHVVELRETQEPLTAQTDPTRVRQILDNLLSNAIKYTPAPGRILVRARIDDGESAPGRGSRARIEVEDSGPGIPPDQREAVFDEFTRLDERNSAQGHGLGLAIARTLSRRLGGDLTVTDAGPGTTFVLWLPLHAGAADESRAG